MELDNEKLINYRVSKGYNREDSAKELEEIKSSFADKNLPSALLHKDFISAKEAEKLSLADTHPFFKKF